MVIMFAFTLKTKKKSKEKTVWRQDRIDKDAADIDSDQVAVPKQDRIG